jgi:hypothetical protein
LVDLKQSWALTTDDLRQAASHLHGIDRLAEFEDYLSHNELQLAADVLRDIADERELSAKAFWESLLAAYVRMGLTNDVDRCKLRLFECGRSDDRHV